MQSSWLDLRPMACQPAITKSIFALVHTLPERTRLSGIGSLSYGPHMQLRSGHSPGAPHSKLSAVSSSSFLSRGFHALGLTVCRMPEAKRLPMCPKASKDVPSSYRYPPMTKKPRWWWRTLACLPYLMPLHGMWMCAETAYCLHPFTENIEFLSYPFFRVILKLPKWFLMAYFFVLYLGIVRRKEWPHFVRFHVVVGLLLEILLQTTGKVSEWMPKSVYWGKLGMHFWTAFAFGFLFTVLECMRCALAGMYADVPFVCEAAYIQIPYD